MVKTKSKGRYIFITFNYILLILIASTCVLPFLNLLAISFSGNGPVAAGKVVFWPIDFTVASYQFALRNGKFFDAFRVSVLRVILGVVLNLVLMVITAYPLSKTKTEVMGRNIYMGFFVLTMLISGGLIPCYLVVVKAGLIDNIFSLILPGALPVYSMIILMNFMRGLPNEIEEAAIIDGASPIIVLTKVLLPLLKPALATVGLFSIVGHWNDWFGGIIYMNDPSKYPLQSYLQTLLQNFDEVLKKANGDYSKLVSMMNARTGRAAQLFLASIPLMIVYPFLQKYFTTGLVLGSVKG